MIALASFALSGCSNAGDEQNSATKKLIVEAQALTPEQIETKANAISQNDYRMFRALMAAGGLDEELGGAAQGDAALRGLMLEFRQQMLGARANLPRLIKAQAGGEAPGVMGLGVSFFAGVLLTDGALETSSGSRTPTGEVATPVEGGTVALSFDEASVTTSSTFTGNVNGLSGKISTSVKLDKCPRPDGGVMIDLVSNSSLTKIGGSAGANIKATAKLIWYVTDDAEFGSNVDTDIRIETAVFGGARGSNGSFVDYRQKTSENTPAVNSTAVNRASSKATEADVARAVEAAKLVQTMALGIAYKATEAFQSGQCVKLEPTSDPAKRSGARAKTSFAVLAAPRSKIDGTPTGGSVTATLTGAGTLDPAGSKVPADAKFTYVAGEKDTKGSVAFEARSKRGMGKATLVFDTMNRAYTISGGTAPMIISGTACNLAEPFTLSDANFTMNFSPSSERGGSYVWSGSIMGMGARGNGSYTVDLNEQGGTISGQGTGYAGGRSGGGAGTVFKLTPTDPC